MEFILWARYIFQTMFNFFPADLLASIDIPRCLFPTRATQLSILLFFQIGWCHRYKSDAVLFDFFLWLLSIFTRSYLFTDMTCLLSFLRMRSIPATFFPALVQLLCTVDPIFPPLLQHLIAVPGSCFLIHTSTPPAMKNAFLDFVGIPCRQPTAAKESDHRFFSMTAYAGKTPACQHTTPLTSAVSFPGDRWKKVEPRSAATCKYKVLITKFLTNCPSQL